MRVVQATKEAAEAGELRWLSLYDYPWNAVQNGRRASSPRPVPAAHAAHSRPDVENRVINNPQKAYVESQPLQMTVGSGFHRCWRSKCGLRALPCTLQNGGRERSSSLPSAPYRRRKRHIELQPSGSCLGGGVTAKPAPKVAPHTPPRRPPRLSPSSP